MVSMQVCRRLTATLLPVVLLIGCSAEGDPDRAGAESADTVLAGARPAASANGSLPAGGTLPAGMVVRETIHIEGMPEEIDARRFEAPGAFPLRFSTLIPADMAVGTAGADDPSVIRIEAEFGGVRRPDAELSIVVLPSGTDEERAVESVAAVVDTLAGAEAERGSIPWALRTYRLGGSRSGFLGLGEREGRWFYILSAYPPEFGDGMGPRVDLILRRWSWSDGSSLIDSGAHR